MTLRATESHFTWNIPVKPPRNNYHRRTHIITVISLPVHTTHAHSTRAAAAYPRYRAGTGWNAWRLLISRHDKSPNITFWPHWLFFPPKINLSIFEIPYIVRRPSPCKPAPYGQTNSAVWCITANAQIQKRSRSVLLRTRRKAWNGRVINNDRPSVRFSCERSASGERSMTLFL